MRRCGDVERRRDSGRMRLLSPESIRGKKTTARLRKAYLAAKLSDYAGRKTRARRSVAKAAWAERLLTA
jgi:hypothetical protein